MDRGTGRGRTKLAGFRPGLLRRGRKTSYFPYAVSRRGRSRLVDAFILLRVDASPNTNIEVDALICVNFDNLESRRREPTLDDLLPPEVRDDDSAKQRVSYIFAQDPGWGRTTLIELYKKALG